MKAYYAIDEYTFGNYFLIDGLDEPVHMYVKYINDDNKHYKFEYKLRQGEGLPDEITNNL